MKLNLVSKKAKTGPTYSEKWHRTHIKKQNVFENEKGNRSTKQKIFRWTPHFLVYKQENSFTK
jgi:hypothetical protein